MAMNLRLPEELDAALARIAEAEHTSKHALLLRGAEMVVSRHSRRAELREQFDRLISEEAEVLRRLEDA